ncbi:putative RNA-binding protein EEED8.10 [Nylanderia fulva]|uniref:putative RNA-binding protein EEED8.10 n=1 Tax=Nylanderia fulva TaxID=613905 RepID=UPI0010FB97FA|nr:putative RNA-binding protein EEED8.10 [Nylanderia fulva]
MINNIEADYTETLHNICKISSNNVLCETTDVVPVRKLFVNNLAERTTLEDLHNCFSAYGHIESYYLNNDQEKENYAFVTFSKVEDAMKAIQEGSKKQIKIHNRELRVMAVNSWHQPDSMDQKLYNIGGISNKSSEEKSTNEQYLQNDTENVSISRLNEDCLRHIFSFLPIIDRIRIERVCKYWKEILCSWKDMKTLDFSPSTWGCTNTDIIRKAILIKVLKKCNKVLTEINLSLINSFLSHENTLTIVGKLCPKLTNVDITALTVSASDIGTLASNCKNITKFSLGLSTRDCDDELINFFKVNKNLKYFSVSKNYIAGKSLLFLPAQTLHTLKLERCENIKDNFVQVLKRLENLKHLALYNCFETPVSTLETIGTYCKGLEKLEIGEGMFYDAQRSDVFYLTQLVNLKVLKFIRSHLVIDEFLNNLANHCQQLISIDITGCDKVTDDGLRAIMTLSKLEKLIINYLYNITGKELKNISNNFKELECRKCMKITDQYMSMFIETTPCLQLLDISGCHKITNVTLDTAKSVYNNRTDNIMLKMIIGGTSIQEAQPSRLLQIVNENLCDGTNTSRNSDEDRFNFSTRFWINEAIDYEYDSPIESDMEV